MRFEEVLLALREGKKITNSIIKNRGYEYLYYFGKTIFCGGGGGYWTLSDREIVDRDDWEIVKEKKKVKLRDLTEEQYKKWFNANCCSKNENKTMSDCFDCAFHNVVCNLETKRCWAKHKNLYSDKFLDQEIEIEE